MKTLITLVTICFFLLSGNTAIAQTATASPPKVIETSQKKLDSLANEVELLETEVDEFLTEQAIQHAEARAVIDKADDVITKTETFLAEQAILHAEVKAFLSDRQ